MNSKELNKSYFAKCSLYMFYKLSICTSVTIKQGKFTQVHVSLCIHMDIMYFFTEKKIYIFDFFLCDIVG